jgi:hypothetical protein
MKNILISIACFSVSLFVQTGQNSSFVKITQKNALRIKEQAYF